MVIQQQVQANNLNVPPPTQVHLSQPPPNIQLQSQNQVATQIVLNQPQNSYQYQYIQQPDPNQQSQVTIQHIYQPVQQNQAVNQFQQQQSVRPQQYIVGNT